MALVSDSMDTLEEVLRSLDAVCSGVGLSISSKKSKILAICPSISLGAPPRAVHLNSEEEPVAVVEEFEYLGSTISQDCTLDRGRSVCALSKLPVPSAPFIGCYGVGRG